MAFLDYNGLAHFKDKLDETYGAELTDLNHHLNAVTEEVNYVDFTPDIDGTYAGLTVSLESDGKLKIYGTSTAARRLLCLNGQKSVATTNTSFSRTLDKGTYDFETSITGYVTSTPTWQYTYTTFSDYAILVSKTNTKKTVTLDNTAMIGFTFSSGTNFGTSDNPTYVSFKATKLSAVDILARDEILNAVDTETADETDKTDMKPYIMDRLNNGGLCQLGEGIFYVSSIDMPSGSRITGAGRKTTIKLLDSVSSGYCVRMESYSTIDNVYIKGQRTATAYTEQGTRSGIVFLGNADGEESGNPTTTYACMLNNVWLANFSDSAIKCHNSSQNVCRGIYGTNIFIASCWCGVNIDYLSEFNTFVNLNTLSCNYGVINNGGNNKFSACIFSAKEYGFYIDGTQPNSGHGAIDCCTFCHIGSNNGSAIAISGVDYGFIINDSNFWYNSIDITNSSGIIFSGCMMGRGVGSGSGATINISGGNTILFVGCMFHKDETYPPAITITNNTKVKFDSCYGSETGNAITAS